MSLLKVRLMIRRFFVIAVVLLLGALPALRADDRPKAVDTTAIKHKLNFKLGDEFSIEFKRDGDRLTDLSASKDAEARKGKVKVKFEVTTASPGVPPRAGATRPYLEMENGFEKTLHFRALVRMKGSKEFFEVPEAREPLPAGESFIQCWDFDSAVEEVILFEFQLTDKRK
jgi:hypothetical protein